MTKPELIVFDLAGTTVEDNYDVHRCLQDAMSEFGVSISREEANDVMGIPKPVAIERLLRLHSKDTSESFIQEMHSTFIKRMTDFYRHDSGVKEKLGVSDTFWELKKANVKIAVDTGFDRVITSALLERMGWSRRGLIDVSVTSDEVVRGRPFPDLVYKAMQLTGVAESRTVAKVGDTASDIGEGKSAGCGWVIGITSGAFSREQLERENPTHLVHTVPELLFIFNLA